jgi:glucose-6-phosphate 1-dehydrogenase
VGAIRDVVQNHLLQIVAFLAMEPPSPAYPESVRDEKAQLFRTIRPLEPDDLVRGQYRGYRTEDGVDARSDVETYAAVRLHIDSWRWDGVPFFIAAGKRLAATATEALITLRRPPLSKLRPSESNYIRFRLGPDTAIAIGVRVKQPGSDEGTEPTELQVVRRANTQEMDAYERLLGEAMEGDASLFAREDAVEAAWAVVQPILDAVTPLRTYEPGSEGPAETSSLLAGIDQCDTPAW